MISLITETWMKPDKLISFKPYHDAHWCRTDTIGGGVMIIIDPNLTHQKIKTSSPELVAVTIKQESHRSLFFCFYNPPSWSKDETMLVFEEIQAILSRYKSPQVVIAGDLNLTPSEVHNMLRNTIQKYNLVVSKLKTRLDATLDYFIASESLQPSFLALEPLDGSDHNQISCEITLSSRLVKLKNIMYDKQMSKGLMDRFLDIIPDPRSLDYLLYHFYRPSLIGRDFGQKLVTLLSEQKGKITKCIKPSLSKSHKTSLKNFKKLALSNTWRDYVKLANTLRRQNWKALWENTNGEFFTDQRKFWKTLKNTTKYNNKAAKNLATTITHNGEILEGEDMNKVLHRHLIQNFDGIQSNEWKTTKYYPFKVISVLDGRYTWPNDGKALSIDLIPDSILVPKQHQSTAELLRVWTIQSLLNNINHPEFFRKHMTGRVIFLNKVFPKTPTVDDLRTITILSPIRKVVEYQILTKLQNFLYTRTSKSQTGFITGLGTDVNLLRYNLNYEKLKRPPISKQMCGVIFIDFKAAFDTVPHQKLLDKVKKLRALNHWELDLLEFILGNSFIQLGSLPPIKTQAGVPQGSTISPFLFNIYLDDLLTEFNKMLIPQDQILCYADDIAIFFHNVFHLDIAIRILTTWSTNNDMRINHRKSGIMLKPSKYYNPRKKLITSHKEYPVVSSYKFLGMTFERTNNLKGHVKLMKAKTFYILARINWIPNETTSPYQKILLWIMLAASSLTYGSLCYSFQVPTCTDSWKKAMKSTFRRALKLQKCFPLKVFDELFNMRKLDELAEATRKRAQAKWDHYKRSDKYFRDPNEEPITPVSDICRYLTWDMITLLNAGQTNQRPCKIHDGVLLSYTHLETQHQPPTNSANTGIMDTITDQLKNVVHPEIDIFAANGKLPPDDEEEKIEERIRLWKMERGSIIRHFRREFEENA